MKTNALKAKLRAGIPVLGPFCKLIDPAVAEIAAAAGFDFLIIDAEHGPASVESAQNLIRAAECAGITPIVRVAENTASLVLRALDIGAHGVQIPQISTKADAVAAVRSAKFHPKGDRGVCRFVRAAGYSSVEKGEHFATSNDETLVIVHIEGLTGIENLPRILETDDLDVVFLGPYDLSQSCGVPGEVDNPVVISKMEEAVRLAAAAGVTVGTFVESAEAARSWRDAGVRYISYSVDVGILLSAFSSIVTESNRIAE